MHLALSFPEAATPSTTHRNPNANVASRRRAGSVERAGGSFGLVR
jgi:hypothetical protein